MRSVALALLIVVLGARLAAADPEADAGAAFRRAGELAARQDRAAIEAYEQLGAQRPVTRWTDDAWAEAARLAEQAREYPRARAALEALLAVSTDERLIARARGSLARLAELGGAEWDAVRAEHERLIAELYGSDDDPTAELEALAALVRAHPTYPRANAARIALALGWETEGERDEALAWYREAADAAAGERGQLTRIGYARALIRAGELAEAEAVLAALDPRLADQADSAVAARVLEVARDRRVIRIGLSVALALALAAVVIIHRRHLRRLARPPIEVWFLVPLAVLLALVALPGNPIIARAVRWIGLAGVVLAWISGGLLELAPRPLSAKRALVHAALTVVAGAAAVYLVVDALGLLDLLGETWRGGPDMD